MSIWLGILGSQPTIIPPGTPTGLTSTFNSTQISLSWTEPTNNGGSAITSYTLQRATDSNFTNNLVTTTNITTTSTTVTGLTNGTLYFFRVAAVNVAGQGDYSSSVSQTPNIVPEVSGGTLTSDATYYYRTITTVGPGQFVVSSAPLSFDWMIVAGGGSGAPGAGVFAGGVAGGGGGAGGVVIGSIVNGIGTYPISVGAGGASAVFGSNVPGAKGQPSTGFGGAASGGGGGWFTVASAGFGGSGGGKGMTPGSASNAVIGQGNFGGSWFNSPSGAGGAGGGGYAAAGTPVNNTGRPGRTGGNGATVLGLDVGGGGGGGGQAANNLVGPGAAGGFGGGGHGSSPPGYSVPGFRPYAQPGVNGTGGGGGGGASNWIGPPTAPGPTSRGPDVACFAGAGGSGVARIRYPRNSVGG